MLPNFTSVPLYRLDDEMPWLEGIDPSRHYWMWVNGDRILSVGIPGLAAETLEQFRDIVLAFRAMQPGETLVLQRSSTTNTLLCVSQNCFAMEDSVEGSPVWHLFDQETVESLLMTGHPDWQCAPKDVELGHRLQAECWEPAIAA